MGVDITSVMIRVNYIDDLPTMVTCGKLHPESCGQMKRRGCKRRMLSYSSPLKIEARNYRSDVPQLSRNPRNVLEFYTNAV